MKPRALVTGGAGFLGSHLCEALLADGYAVVAVDNLLTGRISNIEFLQLDINRPFDCDKVDYVFHFASPASPVDYMVHGIETLKVGSFGTLNALEIVQKYQAKYLVASTSECYGDPLEHPQKETYWGNVNSIGPRSVYDEAKRFTEALTMAYHRYHQVDTRIVRIFNTYGSRMQLNDGRVIPNFMKQALRGDDLTVYGDGQQIRDWLYVRDHCRGIERVLEKGRLGETYNLGGNSERKNLDVVKAICAQLNKISPFSSAQNVSSPSQAQRAAFVMQSFRRMIRSSAGQISPKHEVFCNGKLK